MGKNDIFQRKALNYVRGEGVLNWYPGHMAKTKRLIRENLKWVDVVLELIDARLPVSSRNPILPDLLKQKPLVLLFNKADLADEKATEAWLAHYRRQNYSVLTFNALQNRSKERKRLYNLVRKQAQEELRRRTKRGIKNKIVRLMIIGIPNVGKSTLINNLKGRRVAATGKRPGVTKGKQWIRLDNNLELLDLPGILWPKIDDPEVGYKLAVTGAIKEEIYDPLPLAFWLIEWLKENKAGCLKTIYQIQETQTANLVLTALCEKRGFLQTGGGFDLEKGALFLLREFEQGRLGRVTMDVYQSYNQTN